MAGLAVVLSAAVGCHRGTATARERTDVTVLTPANGALPSQLAAAATKAKADGKRPFVEISAQWCHSCKDLHAAMSDPRMVDAFNGTHIVELDIDAWRDELAGVGLDVTSVPTFFELGEDGRPTGRKLVGDAWSKDVPSSMAPPLKTFFQGR
jgi:thiol:disulfide interchange protein